MKKKKNKNTFLKVIREFKEVKKDFNKACLCWSYNTNTYFISLFSSNYIRLKVLDLEVLTDKNLLNEVYKKN
jgi:hypothetical protein